MLEYEVQAIAAVQTYPQTSVICLPLYVFSSNKLYSKIFVVLCSAYILRKYMIWMSEGL
jgi:hypothetical protein